MINQKQTPNQNSKKSEVPIKNQPTPNLCAPHNIYESEVPVKKPPTTSFSLKIKNTSSLKPSLHKKPKTHISSIHNLYSPTSLTKTSTITHVSQLPASFFKKPTTRKTASPMIHLMRKRLNDLKYHNNLSPSLLERYNKLKGKQYQDDEDISLLKDIYEEAGCQDIEISVCKGEFGWDNGDTYFI